MNLNDSQARAVEHFDGPCLCLAGPGSGKTAVLTQRIKRLIEKGVSADKICVITFTKAAANEMKERFLKICAQGASTTFGTFHSLFWGILSKEYSLKNEDILMGARRLSLIKEAIADSSIEINDNDIVLLYSSEISLINNMGIALSDYTSSQLEADNVRKVYKKYQALKSKYRLYDFDDMLTKAYELFCSNKASLIRWQNRFDYFLIDEMQDMNDIQFKLMMMLAKRTGNIFCVGDDDQSIYGFRGARPGIMNDFLKLYPGCKQILLNYNYRCPANILSCASTLIEHNKDRLAKDIKATKPDGKVLTLGLESVMEEADFVVNQIKELSKKGVSLDEVAILYRNHSAAGFVVERLIEGDIPFYLKEKMPNIYTHYIIDDCLDYFNCAMGNATRKRMLNIINKPVRYIQRSALENGYSIDDIRSYYKDTRGMAVTLNAFERDMNLLSKMSPYAAICYLRQGVGLERYLKEKALEKGQDIAVITEVLDLFSETIRDCKTLAKAIEKVAMLRLKVDYENKNQNASRAGKVGLYTLHSSKGLEFENVFIIGVNETIIPPKKAVAEAEIEAERRLFYVGTTRTKKNLIMTYLNKKNQEKMYPSRFIAEFQNMT